MGPSDTSKYNSSLSNYRNSSNTNVKNHGNWPVINKTADSLVDLADVQVFVDTSFVRSPAFPAFVKMWNEKMASSLTKKVILMSPTEINLLTYDEKVRVAQYGCRTIAGASIDEVFRNLAQKTQNVNIVWLTAETDKTKEKLAAQKSGFSLRWYGISNEGKVIPLLSSSNKNTHPNIDVKKPPELMFPICSDPKSISRVAMSTRVPAHGEYVKSANGKEMYRLVRPVMTDSVSITYSTDKPEYFVKIYTERALAIDIFRNKAELMVSKQPTIKNVCWPKDTVVNTENQFCGIVVPASAGVQLSQVIMNGGITKNLPGWNKTHICLLALTLLDAITEMHKKGILFGCLNPATVYFSPNNPGKVYFVDVDNWQIEGYPASSKNITFTPPEAVDQTNPFKLYTLDQDYYQVAVLTYLLMMPGKFPYSKRRDSNVAEAIKERAFPFSFGSARRSEDAERPSGVWRIVWDHLPYKMCEAFFNAFSYNGKNSKPGSRIKTQYWRRLVEEYANYLKTDAAVASRPLFPETYRRDEKRTFVRCSICGKEHPDFYFLKSIKLKGERVDVWAKGYRVCLPCTEDKSDVSFRCECCGKEFIYTNKAKILHTIGKAEFEFKNQRWCHDCKKRTQLCSVCGEETPVYQISDFFDRRRNAKFKVCGKCKRELIQQEKNRSNQVYQTKICKNCGKPFAITVGEAESLQSKGFTLPLRCPICRGKRY